MTLLVNTCYSTPSFLIVSKGNTMYGVDFNGNKTKLVEFQNEYLIDFEYSSKSKYLLLRSMDTGQGDFYKTNQISIYKIGDDNENLNAILIDTFSVYCLSVKFSNDGETIFLDCFSSYSKGKNDLSYYTEAYDVVSKKRKKLLTGENVFLCKFESNNFLYFSDNSIKKYGSNSTILENKNLKEISEVCTDSENVFILGKKTELGHYSICKIQNNKCLECYSSEDEIKGLYIKNDNYLLFNKVIFISDSTNNNWAYYAVFSLNISTHEQKKVFDLFEFYRIIRNNRVKDDEEYFSNYTGSFLFETNGNWDFHTNPVISFETDSNKKLIILTDDGVKIFCNI